MRPSRFRSRAVRHRLGVFVVVVTAASLTGLYWRSARSGDVVRAGISVRIDAHVQADGAIAVTETLELDPSRLPEHQLVRRIPTPDPTSVVLRSVSDDDDRPLPAVARQGSGTNLAVHVEVGEEGSIVLRYSVLGAVRAQGGEVVAALRWLGTDSPLAIDELTASIVWPAAGGVASAVEGFVGDRRLRPDTSASSVRFDTGPVPAHTAAGGGARFDGAAVQGLGNQAGSAGGLDQLRDVADGASRVAWDVIGVVAGLAVLAGWALLQWARGREYAVPSALSESRPPSRHTPAEVGWLLRFGEVRHGDLTATLIDLTSRGYLIPHRREGRVILGRGRPPDGLRPHEELVLDWLFPGGVTECDLGARNADIRSQPEGWEGMWERFVDEVRSVGQSNALVERQADAYGVVMLGFAGLVVVALGVAGLAASRLGWLACVVAGSVVLAGATAFARRSPEGALLAARWEAFGRALRGEAAGSTVAPPDLGPQALAYAVALHESDAAAVMLDAHQAGAGVHWPTQLIDREVESHVNRWRESYLVATSIRGAPSARLRALLSRRALSATERRRPRTSVHGRPNRRSRP